MHVKCNNCLYAYEISIIKIQNWYQNYVSRSGLFCPNCQANLIVPTDEEAREYQIYLQKQRMKIELNTIFKGVCIGIAVVIVLGLIVTLLEAGYAALASLITLIGVMVWWEKGESRLQKSNPLILQVSKNGT